jgi:2-desacetyl-2-hydroxyethyl bacteriochlorophyllide A dehydrogenase
MKAIRLHAPRDARYEEVPVPRLRPDDVLVKIRAAAICATDIELHDGVMVYLTSGMASYPLIPGHEWSGEVVDVGSDVTEFSLGDRVVGECSIGCRGCVYCQRGWYHLCPRRSETGILKQDGGFAEYISFPRFSLHRCNGLRFEDAALIEPTGVALNAVKRAGVTPGDRVAVFGPGPIGLIAVQVAKAYGARQVILVGTRDERLSVGEAVGADITINSRKERLHGRIREATDGEMIEVVIEAAGSKDVWPDIASVLAPRARVAMTGLFGGALCGVAFDPLVVNEVVVYGCLGSPNLWLEAISLHHRGMVGCDKIVTHKLPLEQFSQGIELARNRVDGAIKVVVEP